MTRRLCLVTGASAGIGQAFARIFASHGYDVALTARRGERLEQLAEEIRLRYGVETLAIPADLGDPAAAAHLIETLAANGRVVDALVNNAGYGLRGNYAATAWDEERAFLQVLLIAVCELTHKLLPGMIERRFGRIVNVASLAGLTPGAPGRTLYSATKSFLVKFSESLHLETRDQGVHVSALCPGLTYSEFHDTNQTRESLERLTPDWLWLGADEVAAAGYEAVEANRIICVPGAPNKAIAVLAKLAPEDWAMALMGREQRRIGRL
ncbi:MAG TPA: SDR family oxidoreductase [Caulobacteraceae bacterium]|jgi:short-subunit dehydrogenase